MWQSALCDSHSKLNAKNSSCFYPVPQAADCINRAVERSTAPVVYLSTDAAESETGLLQLLLVVNGKKVPLVRRPTRNSNDKWDTLLYRHGLKEDRQDAFGAESDDILMLNKLENHGKDATRQGIKRGRTNT
ncbi:hypothetical protein P3L10_015592 [Capsicum annuum]